MHYILDGREPKLCKDVIEWARWYEKNNRHVADDTVNDVRVSTVFLGLDHNFLSGGPPDEDTIRYSTWDEAEKGHAEILEREKNMQASVPMLRKIKIIVGRLMTIAWDCWFKSSRSIFFKK